jgi:hypothetical protein
MLDGWLCLGPRFAQISESSIQAELKESMLSCIAHDGAKNNRERKQPLDGEAIRCLDNPADAFREAQNEGRSYEEENARLSRVACSSRIRAA